MIKKMLPKPKTNENISLFDLALRLNARKRGMTGRMHGDNIEITPVKKEIKGTINPYMQSAAPEPGFVLSPIKRINEKKDLIDLEYEGKEVILTRDNTEADNGSITSHEQALLSYNNGKWSIEDKSEQGTTFVRASRKIELNNGDVILLGNRLFEFRVSEN